MKLLCNIFDHKWVYKTEKYKIDLYIGSASFTLDADGKFIMSKDVRLCSRCNKKEKKILVNPGYTPRNWKQEERWVDDEYSTEELRDMKINELLS